MNLQSLRAGIHGSYDARLFASLLSELLVAQEVSLLPYFGGGRSPWGVAAAIFFAGCGRGFVQTFLTLHTLDM